MLVVDRQRCVWWCLVLPEVDDASGGGDNWAEGGEAAASVANDFPADSILLVGECEGDEGCREELSVGGLL